MKTVVTRLPSNKNFGVLFGILFFIIGIYFYYQIMVAFSFFFVTCGILFIIIAFIKPEVLIPFNKLWMMFGFLLGNIISPIVLGIIFFGIFTPYSLFLKIFGRDELRLNKIKQNSYWINRTPSEDENNFNNQF